MLFVYQLPSSTSPGMLMGSAPSSTLTIAAGVYAAIVQEALGASWTL